MHQSESKILQKKGGKQWLNLQVPEFLLCALGGEIMKDPVMLTSGLTFDRVNIEQYLNYKRDELVIKLKEDDDEFDQGRHFICPVTSKVINPDRLIPNARIKKACTEFLKKNPWAHEFDPRQQFSQIKVWAD